VHACVRACMRANLPKCIPLFVTVVVFFYQSKKQIYKKTFLLVTTIFYKITIRLHALRLYGR